MLRVIVILLTLATAGVHLSFFIPNPGKEWIYGLNALGYVILAALLYFPGARWDVVRPLIRRLFMLYTAATVAAYVLFGLVFREWTVPLGPMTKLIEASLIGLLWWEDQHTSPAFRSH